MLKTILSCAVLVALGMLIERNIVSPANGLDQADDAIYEYRQSVNADPAVLTELEGLRADLWVAYTTHDFTQANHLLQIILSKVRIPDEV